MVNIKGDWFLKYLCCENGAAAKFLLKQGYGLVNLFLCNKLKTNTIPLLLQQGGNIQFIEVFRRFCIQKHLFSESSKHFRQIIHNWGPKFSNSSKMDSAHSFARVVWKENRFENFWEAPNMWMKHALLPFLGRGNLMY